MNQDIKDNVELDLKPDGEFTMRRVVVQDNIPTLTANQFEKMHGNNGFAPSRTMRKVASIPFVAALEAQRLGYNLDDKKDLFRFLNEHPEFMVVDKLNSNRSPNIIVK